MRIYCQSSMRKNKIAVIILNYFGDEDTIECLESLSKFSSGESIEIYVVDNGSSADISLADNKACNFIYIKNEVNLGFAEGNNVGIRRALANNVDFILLLNNDTVLIDNSIFVLAEKLMGEKDLGIGGIVNYYYSDPEKLWQAGCINNFITTTPKPITKFDAKIDNLTYVDYIPGASMLIKSEVLNKIGLLDDRYFAYYEEYDFCQRAKKAGYGIAFLQNSKILHKVGKSSPSKVKQYLRTRNGMIFYSMHANLFSVCIVAMKNIFKGTVMSIKNRSMDMIKVTLRGVVDYRRKKFGTGSLAKLLSNKK